MKTRQLGNSDLNITPIGVGAGPWAAANGNGVGVRRTTRIPSRRFTKLWITELTGDTAAVYGLGHSEEVVARALLGCSNKPYVFTKAERVWYEKGNITGSLKASSIREEVEASLCRLNLDTIDLYQINWPQPDEDIEEGWKEMLRLKEQGKVRYDSSPEP
jgi:aryl-alcohol dehydrogenase-like predicted oxidoreductase